MAGCGLGHDDLGAEIGEDAARHRGGLARQVDDPHPGEQWVFVDHDGLHCS